jgi:nucleoside-diphosphate-sugar epimerase
MGASEGRTIVNLFVLGLGYSALHFAHRFGQRFTTVSGTVRSAEKAKRLAEIGIGCVNFSGHSLDDDLIARVLAADIILDTIPPGQIAPLVQQQLQRALASARPRQIIYLSTLAVYGNRNGQWVDETTIPMPESHRGTARLAAENAWIEWARETSATVSILRLAGIYGPGRNVLIQLRNGTARAVVKAGQVFNRIHVEDIARSIANAAALGFGGIVNVADDEPAPVEEVLTFAASLMQVPLPPLVPFESAELSPLGRSFYAENKRASNLRLKRELAVSLAYPTYREGLKALYEAGDGG